MKVNKLANLNKVLDAGRSGSFLKFAVVSERPERIERASEQVERIDYPLANLVPNYSSGVSESLGGCKVTFNTYDLCFTIYSSHRGYFFHCALIVTRMRTADGTEFVLLDRCYLTDIEKRAPKQVPVCLEQLERCGYIVAFPYVNKYLGCYEPISTTCILNDIYFYLENQIN